MTGTRTVRPTYRTLIAIPTRVDGPRVTLRPLAPADAPAFLAAVAESRAALVSWVRGVSRLKDLDDVSDYVARMTADWIERSRLCFAVRDGQDQGLLGEVTLQRIDWDAGSAEVGFWLRSSATGHGYMTEAVGLLVDLFLGRLGGQRIVLRADARNDASIAIAERLAFTREGMLRRTVRGPDDALRDVVIYARLRDDNRSISGSDSAPSRRP